MIDRVIQHIESHFGRISSRAGYWRFPLDGRWLQVVAFAHTPRRGVVTLCTLGLSHSILDQGGHPVRHELLTACRRQDAGDGRIASVLMTVAEALAGHGRSAADGEVYGPFGPILAEAGLSEYTLARTPEPFKGSLAVCRETEPETRFVWLAPLDAAEASAAAERGLDGLYRTWAEGRADLLDWRRRPRD